MKISGFTFIRNGLKLDYPFIEAIQSILPICDEMIVVIGNSEDETKETIVALNEPKIKIIETIWDDNLREGGKILAQQTDIALQHITGDWGFYIQGDEVLHEDYLDTVKHAMQENLLKPEVEGLLFKYKHFYGSYDYIGNSRKWYRREIRVVRNHLGVSSYRDAQGFRIDNKKLKVKLIDAEIYHYGWVRDPRAQQLKSKSFHRLWHDDQWMAEKISDADEHDYNLLESLAKFNGTHPKVLSNRLKRMNWEFNYNPELKKPQTFKEKLSNYIEKNTGYRFGEYRNYKII
jgi:hypothetical protein